MQALLHKAVPLIVGRLRFGLKVYRRFGVQGRVYAEALLYKVVPCARACVHGVRTRTRTRYCTALQCC